MPAGAARRALAAGPILVALLAGAARGEARDSLATWFPQLRPGTWIKVEGLPDSTGGLRAAEIKILSGELDESEVTTLVTGVDLEKRRLATRLGIRIEIGPRTRVERSKRARSTWNELVAGDRIEVEGQLQANGPLVADQIEVKGPERPEGGTEDRLEEDEITGRIESVDSAAHKVVLLGTPVIFDARTKNKTPFAH